MLPIWRKSRTLLTSVCLILFISGCGLKGPLYQTPAEAPTTISTDKQKIAGKDTNNVNQNINKATVPATNQEIK